MPCSKENDADPLPIEGATLERLEERDLDQVLAIENASFASPWRREHFRYEIHDNRWAVNWVVRRGVQVLAYACVWELRGELKINNIAVHPPHRRAGLGRWLLRRVLAHAKAERCSVARLEVRTSNRAALELYQAHGFREVGRRKGYYQREGEDAILMERAL